MRGEVFAGIGVSALIAAAILWRMLRKAPATDGAGTSPPAPVPKFPTPYDGIISDAAARYGVDPFLLKAIAWKENRFRVVPDGTSGEKGPFQMMPKTATSPEVGITEAQWRTLSTEAGWPLAADTAAKYLKWLKRYPGVTNEDTAISAYNQGIGNALKDVKEGRVFRNLAYVNDVKRARSVFARDGELKAVAVASNWKTAITNELG